MLRTTLLALLALAGIGLHAQVQFFETYADWRAGKPSATYAKDRGHGMSFGKPYLIVSDEEGGKTKNVSLKNVWGYVKNGKLYRWDKKDSYRNVVLKTEGAICEWASISAGRDYSNNTVSDYLLFITVGVDGKIIPLPHGLKNPPQGRYNSFKQEHRDGHLAHFIACLEATDQVEAAKDCIARFNETHGTEP